MKGIKTIVLFILGLEIASGQNSCPSDGHIYHSYPHESDCTQFYKCDWGKPYAFLCPLADSAGNRLIFNPVLKVCDWPDSAIAAGAKCSGGPTTTGPTTSPFPSSTTPTPTLTTLPPGQCPPNNEYYHSYPHKTECHKYYVCDWGQSVEKICPIADAATGARLVFNPVLQVCDWPEAAIGAGAVCAATTTPSTTTPSTTTPSTTTPSTTTPSTATPSTTTPSTTTPSTTTPTTTTTKPPTLPPGQCPPNNEYYHSYPHETDCHKFYVCDWGQSVEKICPIADAGTGARLVFNPVLQVCDWPEAAIAAGAVCAATTTPSTTTPSTTTPSTTTPSTTTPSTTTPSTTTPTTTTTKPPTLPPGQCPPNNEYYHSYPHETDCHKFYVCDWGQSVEKICPIADAATGARLVFNPVLQVCDWPEAAIAAGAVCAATTTPSTTTPSTTTPSTTTPSTTTPTTTTTKPQTLPPGQCPPNNEYYHSYPHETDCHKFYVCDWGQSVEKICPIADAATGARLVFNPVLQVCDWPEAAIAAGAVCAATTTPSTTTPSTTTPSTTTPSTTTPTTTTTKPQTLPPGQCPPNNEYYHSYPHETDCHKFYVCDWGQSVEKICPIADAATGARLVFNPVLQVCDWPEAAIAAGAVCAATTTPSTTTPSTTPSTTTPSTTTPSTTTPSTTTPTTTTTKPPTLPPGQCPPNNEYYHSYPHETDCHKFYVCDWGQSVEKICPIADAATGARLVFNPVLQVCDWPEAAIAAGAVCAATTTPSTTTPSTTTPSTTTPSTTTPSTTTPSTTTPSTTTPSTTTPTTTTTKPPTLPPGQCPPNNEYYHSYPHETDCHKFYVCDWGQSVEKICPIADAATGARLVFNPVLQVCDWPEAAIAAGAVCAATTTPSTTTPSTTTPSTTTPSTTTPTTTTTKPQTLPPGQCPPNNEYYHSYPHETDCHKFYVCDWGQSVEKICPIADAATGARLVFNPVLQVCDWPEAAIAAGAVCAATTTPSTTTPSTTTPSTTTPSTTTPSTTTPSTTTPTTTTTKPPTLPPGQCPPNNEYYHSYPHETDCHKFYVCDWGQSVEKICPIADAATGARLVFNPVLQVCDWPEAAIAAGAVCAATTTPSTTTPSTTTPSTTTPSTTTPSTTTPSTTTPSTTTPSTTTPTTTTTKPPTLPPGQCPPNNEYYHSYPHETDCHKFYVCDWGQSVEKICPIADAATGARLVFNPVLQVCDWPEAAIAAGAVCAATTTPSTTTPSTTTPSTTTPSTTTPSTTTPSTTTPSTTTPSTTTPTTTTTKPPTLPPGQCPPNNEYYHSYPHETDCHKFYVCDWGQSVEKICPIADAATGARLVFNPVLQVCDWPEAAIAAGAVCAATTTPSTTTPSTTTPSTTTPSTTTPSTTTPSTTTPTTTTTKPPTLPPGQCPPNNDYYHSYPHETDCHKFYVCDWGQSVEKICPIANVATGARLVFNPVLQVCDWPEAAIAAGAVCAATTTPSTTTPSTTAPSTTTPSTTTPSTTTPSTTTPTTTTTKPPTLPPGQCPPNNEYYHSYPHETDCHKFYVCDWGQSVEKICPIADAATGARLVFNPVLQVCDWPEAAIAAGAVCAATTTPSTTTPSTTTPSTTTPSTTTPSTTTPSTTTPTTTTTKPPTLPPGQCPPNNEYYHSYPHETDCHKFYVCDWGQSVEKICPIADAATGARLVFNPVLQVCDWPEAAIAAGAVCAATTTPSTTTPSTTTPSTTTPSTTTPSTTTPSTTTPSTTTPSTTTPTTTTTKPPTLPPGQCPPNNEYYHSYPHETDCHKFYVCDWGQSVEKICPIADVATGARLVFNPVLQVCDWPDAAITAGAVCAATTTPPIISTPTVPSSRYCPPNNEYYHSYPHETNCNHFYVCDWGVPIEKICPLADSAGNKLVFNPKLQVCDWRNNAIANGAVC